MSWTYPAEYEPGQASGDLMYLSVASDGGLRVFTSIPAGDEGNVLAVVDGVPAWTDGADIAITGDFTVTGLTSHPGGLRTGALLETGSGATVTNTKSMHLIVCNAATDVASTYVLPLAATAGGGCFFTFVFAPSSLGSNRELKVETPIGTDYIVGTTTPAGGTGIATTAGTGHGIKNTHATAVRGNFVTIGSDGVGIWYMTALGGTWAAY